MKKYLFVLAATAGLFASCSSDDVAQAPNMDLNVNDSEMASIKIGIANPGATRGTGTVGSTDAATNVWAGQTFNLFMFNKGTFVPAKKTIDGVESDIYNNAKMTAPNAGTADGASTLIIDDVVNYNYYPQTGAFDFWAYRIDDAVTTGVEGVGDATADAATEIVVPFEINGSQDIMTAIPDPVADLATLQVGYPTATADQIYSAYAARRGVNPRLVFSHMLTRLTFQVKAAAKEVSDAAVLDASAPAAAYPGVKVTSISVKSKKTGRIIAAYKDASTYTAPTVEWTDAAEDWADPTTLTEMFLMSRGEGVTTKEEGTFTAVNVDIAADGTAAYGSFYDEGLGGTRTADALVAVYPANTTNDKTGKPNTALTTLGALVDAYLAANEDATTPGTYTAGTVTGYTYAVTTAYVGSGSTDPAADLVELVETTPGWDGTDATAAVDEVAYVATADVASDEATYDAAAADAKLDNSTGDATSLDAWKKTLPVGAGYIYFDGTNYFTFDITTAYVAPVAASAGTENTVKTDVGEALLVAPADANGYEIVVNYKRWKANSDTDWREMDGTITKTISRASGLHFGGNESYNIVITLYADGNATTDTELKPWTPKEEFEVDGE